MPSLKLPLDTDDDATVTNSTFRALRTEAIAVFLVWHVKVRLILALVDWLIMKNNVSFVRSERQSWKKFCEDTWVAWKKFDFSCFYFHLSNYY